MLRGRIEGAGGKKKENKGRRIEKDKPEGSVGMGKKSKWIL